jgi:hypothetical protein
LDFFLWNFNSMDLTIKDYIRHAARCHELAHAAPTEALRAFLLRIARQYEREAGLAQRAFQCVVESKELIAKAEIVLNRQSC